jgi:outer membrane protein insertion porin family
MSFVVCVVNKKTDRVFLPISAGLLAAVVGMTADCLSANAQSVPPSPVPQPSAETGESGPLAQNPAFSTLATPAPLLAVSEISEVVPPSATLPTTLPHMSAPIPAASSTAPSSLGRLAAPVRLPATMRNGVVPLAQAPASPAPGTPVPPPAAAPAPPPPTAAPAPAIPAPPVAPPSGADPQVLIGEVVVQGVTGELEQLIYQTIRTRPGQTATRTQLQQDTNAIFATGFFADVKAEPSDTPLGVKVTFRVQPYPVLRSVQVAGARVLTQAQVDQIFAPQYGKNMNLRQIQQGIEQINKFYQDKGYIVAQVAGTPQIDQDGTVTLQVAEGVVEQITPRFLDKEGKPARGRTRPYILTRELRTQPGEVLNRDVVQADLKRLSDLGLFEDVQVSLEPGQDPRRVNVILNIKERKTGSFSAGAGFSSSSGLFGTGSYQQANLFGRNQKVNAEVQAGTRGEILFDVGFTDPWIRGDKYRTSYSANVFNRLTQPFVFNGGPNDVDLPNGDTPRVNRLGSSLVFTRPLTRDPDKIRRAWIASLGMQYQRVSIRDGNFNVQRFDELGNPLSVSGRGQDDLLTMQAAIVRDLRNDAMRPTTGSLIRLGIDQSIPVGLGNILMTRARGSYSYYIPVKILRKAKGPQAFAFNIQGGTILGDAPGYEAFSIGGSNSVRGYGEGDLGTGRSFLQGTAEYRFPIFKIVGGALFLDAASTLGTQGSVLGRPGEARGKPGQGFGYGVGVRVNTPLGNIRVDYGINDQGNTAITFGIGERF